VQSTKTPKKQARGGFVWQKHFSAFPAAAAPWQRGTRSLQSASPVIPGRPLILPAVLAFVFALVAVAAPARAASDTALDVDAGWNEITRQGAWTPLYVRVSDPKPRNAYIELSTPHDATTSVKVRIGITLNPSPQTYELLAPLVATYNEPIRLEVHDAGSHRLLASETLYDNDIVDPGDIPKKHATLFGDRRGGGKFTLIGLSGRGGVPGQLRTADSSSGADVIDIGRLSQPRLPRAPQGYEALRALILSEPDLAAMEPEQQNAICDWVRAGGHLVLWPGEGPIPPASNSPLVGLLPCGIGDVTTVTFADRAAVVRQFGLPERFATGKLKARALTPAASTDAQVIPILEQRSPPLALRAPRGLGDVTVLAFDASGLDFIDNPSAAKFWEPILQLDDGSTAVSGSAIQTDQRSMAVGQIMDLLGDVPGIGTFGFKYVAMVLMAMMVIVGPVDWFVLKWMGRQPWTWVTTAGWIGLITTAAIFVGSVFKSGDLHLRTLRVIDQAGGAVIARTDVVGIYSPRTDDYDLDVRPRSWWRPISSDQWGYGRGTIIRPVPFTQNGVENKPARMTINVWNLRFLAGETLERAPAVLAASLSPKQTTISAGKVETHITGTITNQGDVPLTALWLRTSKATIDLTRQAAWPATGGLPPGATLAVDAPIDYGAGMDYWRHVNESTGYSYTRRGMRRESIPLGDARAVVRAAGELSTLRTDRINHLLDSQQQAAAPTIAVLYAESEAPVAAAKLIGDQKPIEKHWQVVRALVPLNGKPE
jgi:hypothetical protein